MSINNLEEFASQFTFLLKQTPSLENIITEGREMLSELTSNSAWFQPVLSRLVLDDDFLKSQWQSIDPYDIQLYHSPEKLFSVRAFVWEPEEFYPPHDHGSWGIVGALINPVNEKKFARVDDGSNIHYAEIKQISEAQLSPGQTTYVLPLNEGIHQMAAVNDTPSVSIHVYGQPVRKGYIHYYNRHNNTAQRMYPPSINKRIYAIRTLSSIGQSWAADVLQEALQSAAPDYVLQEIQYSLDKIKPD